MKFSSPLRLALACVIAFGLMVNPVAQASQGSLVIPTTGTLSGLAAMNDINAALDALASCNSGASQPLNSAAAPSAWQFWCDTSVAGKGTLKQYDGSNWLILGVLDTSSHIWTPPVGGGAPITLASGATVDLGSVPQSVVTISGTTTITSLGSSAIVGTHHYMRFSGALTLTHNGTSLILPNNGGNITTAAGDSADAIYLGGGNWAVLWYSQANGTALLTSGTIGGAFSLTGAAAITLSSSTNDWAPGSTKSVVKLTINNASGINITGIAAPANDGNIIIIDVQVASTGNLTLVTQSSSSAAANRFLSPTTTVKPGQQAVLKYDTTASRWWIMQPEVISDARQGVTSSGRQIIASPADGSSGAFGARAPDARDTVYGPKAWVTWTMSGTSVTVSASYNASVTRSATGDFIITFGSPMADANYVLSGVGQRTNIGNVGLYYTFKPGVTPSTTSFEILSLDDAGGAEDGVRHGLVVFGN